MSTIPIRFRPLARVAALASSCLFGGAALADVEVQPAPASVGADIPVTYFGPPPSSVEPELIGPHQLLKAGTMDLDEGTVTLPLYQGRMQDGRNVWYVLTDTTDEANAAALGLNFSSKLSYAGVCRGARDGVMETDGSITFAQGTVDFVPERRITPGAAGQPFPPSLSEPGSMGDDDYSPLVRIENAGGHIYNAPMLAFDVDADAISFCDGRVDHEKVHDKVRRICPQDGTVTLNLTTGFSFSRPVVYISTESNSVVAAALEGATLAPGLQDIAVGADDSAFSAVERLFSFSNGPVNLAPNEVNPQRQGLASALVDGGSPLNVLGGIPTIATDYSPLWDFNLGEWTADAISKGYRSRLTEEFQILGMVARGFVVGPGGAPYGSTGIVVNCPIVARLL